ncbi:hypothetical protein AKJ41_04230 [candidate division MSBL1 archaeon SCGC-AAA259O05]|uniref:Uncharacterized protein n=1 Tax=candidate division MSBL1 archaeon SCGC-AAA259O05 TaxID=1698271 RepID=A0A133V1C2_9EURY|nr:hypothetical protein AKJ41_04230 [candidate division MSBL1 archaeon SCGC-AAA259O05]
MMNLLSLLSLHHVERLLLQTSSVSSLLTRGNGLTFPHPSRKDISTKKKDYQKEGKIWDWRNTSRNSFSDEIIP